MRVISIPKRLKLSIAGLALCIPLIGLEVIIVTRSPIWRLPYRNMGFWALGFTLLYLPLALGLASARKWIYLLTVILSSVWIIASIWVALATGYPPLGYFSILLLAYLALELSWLRIELKRSFIDPDIAWYQGIPKPIPGLECELIGDEEVLKMRVSRMDHDGIFLYSNSERSKPFLLSSLSKPRKLKLNLHFGKQQVQCDGIPIISTTSGSGIGIQFLHSSEDLKKEIGDFVEILRGQGYV